MAKSKWVFYIFQMLIMFSLVSSAVKANPMVDQNNIGHLAETSQSVISDKVTTSSGDTWVFPALEGDLLTISMKGIDKFDTYLELYSPSGMLLVADDDSGGGGSSLISNYAVSAGGNYKLVCKGYKGSLGSYTLSVTITRKTNPSKTSGDSSVYINSVKNYWSYLNNKDYSNAWKNLTPSFKERKHDGSYENYVNGYKAMAVCSI